MALFGLWTGVLGASLADLAGNQQTRWFTRRAFALGVTIEAGVTVNGLASFGKNLWGALPI